MSGGGPRRRSRQVALQVLYAVDVSAAARSATALLDQEVFERFAENFELPEAARAFAKELVHGVTNHRDNLDERIAARAKNWRISRMAAVDRNILRLATYELAHTDTPDTVVLDEAVELARRFGDDPSPAFVNGILDAIAKDDSGD